MNKLLLANFNLETTLLGGQAFNWDFKDGVFYGFTQDKIILIKPAHSSQQIYWQTYPVQNDFTYLQNYLNLNVDYNKILLNIQKDQFIRQAVGFIPDVRVLNQDFEQTLLSFILTSHKNIKAVRKVIRDLARNHGERIEINLEDKVNEFFLFPKTEVIADLSEKELRKIGAGFRARYLKEAAERLESGELNAVNLKGLSEGDVRDKLLKFNGIGDKIADCIMSFSLNFTTVTPIDIWGKRVLVELYNVDQNLKYSEMRKWYRDYFGEYTVWAGQFLFEWFRNQTRR